jgi:hypothetical protein
MQNYNGPSVYIYTQPSGSIESFCQNKYLALLELDTGCAKADVVLKTISDILISLMELQL